MKLGLRPCLGLFALSSTFFMFGGCSDNDDPVVAGAGGETSEASGAAECEVVGELCHEADTGSGVAHDCHELAHHGQGAACLESFASCIDSCVPDDDGDKDPHCAALGELCHPVDDKDGPLHECHELGHVNDAEACAASFDDCTTKCLAAREALEEADSGGAGGAGGLIGSGGAGGLIGSGGAAGAH
jgi:hypothetical protein